MAGSQSSLSSCYTLPRQRLKPTFMAMDSLLASRWPGPAPAPAPAEEEKVFSYWDAPSDNTAVAPAAPSSSRRNCLSGDNKLYCLNCCLYDDSC